MFWIIIIVILIAAGVYQSKNRANSNTSRASSKTSPQDRIIPRGGIPHMLTPMGRTGIVGEQYHKPEIRTAIGDGIVKVAPLGEWGKTLKVNAEIRRQSNNTHDPNAVAVIINEQLVGYIKSEDTHRWQPLLQNLESQGKYAVATADVYSSHGDGFDIILEADPESPEMMNTQPDGIILPSDRPVAVSGEEDAQEVLTPYVGDIVWASLATGVIPKGKYKDQQTVWAYVDNAKVGYISNFQAARYYSLVESSIPCVCMAQVTQGNNKIELNLLLPKKD